MIGIILCGGESKRMGNDKGLLQTGSEAWAKIAADKISGLHFSVALSVNENQLHDYAACFPDFWFVKDNDSLGIKGPLCGLLSAHLQYPQNDLLVLACDMPAINTDLLKQLLDQYHRLPDMDAIIFSTDNEPEPLCGIYSGKGLAKIYALYVNGQLAKHSMKYMLEQMDTYIIPATDAQLGLFKNINSHADLNGL